MDSVEHMTNALQVAAQAMRTARERNRPPEVMDLLERSRQRILRIAKKEADVDIASNGVKALALVVDGDYAGAIKILRGTQVEWRQRGVISQNALALIEGSKDQVIGTGQLDPAMAQWTYDYFVTDLRRRIEIAGELAEEYVALEGEAIQGAQALGVGL